MALKLEKKGQREEVPICDRKVIAALTLLFMLLAPNFPQQHKFFSHYLNHIGDHNIMDSEVHFVNTTSTHTDGNNIDDQSAALDIDDTIRENEATMDQVNLTAELGDDGASTNANSEKDAILDFGIHTEEHSENSSVVDRIVTTFRENATSAGQDNMTSDSIWEGANNESTEEAFDNATSVHSVNTISGDVVARLRGTTTSADHVNASSDMQFDDTNGFLINSTNVTRDIRIKILREKAIERIHNISTSSPDMNLTDLQQVPGLVLSPALIDSIHHTRYYRKVNGFTTSQLNVTLNNSKMHFLSHIPKTGLTFGFRLLNTLILKSPQYSILPQTDRFKVCDVALALNFDNQRGDHKGAVCNMWMSEHPTPSGFDNAFTVIRDPRQHVLSQYFHCTESKPHKAKAHFMPSTLDEWLEAWVEKSKEKKGTGEFATKEGADPEFKCYDPRNHQTYFTKYHLPTGVSPNDETFEQQAKEQVIARYTVLGDAARLEQTMCVIMAEWTGWVPPRCDCTDLSEAKMQQLTDTGPAIDPAAHGVSHHGGSYNTTEHQDELISQLTRWDRKLYEIAKEAFEEKLAATEAEYGVRICKELRSDIQWDGTPTKVTSAVTSKSKVSTVTATNGKSRRRLRWSRASTGN